MFAPFLHCSYVLLLRCRLYIIAGSWRRVVCLSAAVFCPVLMTWEDTAGGFLPSLLVLNIDLFYKSLKTSPSDKWVSSIDLYLITSLVIKQFWWMPRLFMWGKNYFWFSSFACFHNSTMMCFCLETFPCVLSGNLRCWNVIGSGRRK